MTASHDEIETDTKLPQGASVAYDEDLDSSGLSPDEKDMRRMGKVQETRVRSVLHSDADNVLTVRQRNFGLLPLLGFTTIMLNSWECVFP